MSRNNSGMVTAIFWTLEIEKSGITDASSGSFDLEPSSNPIPFEELTQEVVSNWIENLMDPTRLSKLKHFLETQVDYKLSNMFTEEVSENISGLPVNFS